MGGNVSIDQDNERYTNELFELSLDSMGSVHCRKLEAGEDAPTERLEPSLAMINDKQLILFGGENSQRTFNDLWIYNIERNQWTEIYPKGVQLEGRIAHIATFYDGKFINFGGMTSEKEVLNEIAILHFGECSQAAARKATIKEQFENIDSLLAELSTERKSQEEPNCTKCGHRQKECEFLRKFPNFKFPNVSFYSKPQISSKFIDELNYDDPIMTLASAAFALQPFCSEIKYVYEDCNITISGNLGILSDKFLAALDGTVPNSALVPLLKLSDKFYGITTTDAFKTIVGVVKKKFVKVYIVLFNSKLEPIFPQDPYLLNHNLMKLHQHFKIDNEIITSDPNPELTYICLKTDFFLASNHDITCGRSSLRNNLEYLYLRNEESNLRFIVQELNVIPKFPDKYMSRSEAVKSTHFSEYKINSRTSLEGILVYYNGVLAYYAPKDDSEQVSIVTLNNPKHVLRPCVIRWCYELSELLTVVNKRRRLE